jgi:hypothetical protein
VVKDVNAIQRRLVLVVIVATPRTFLVLSESIQAPLDTDNLMFYDTCRTSSSMIGEITQKKFIDK